MYPCRHEYPLPPPDDETGADSGNVASGSHFTRTVARNEETGETIEAWVETGSFMVDDLPPIVARTPLDEMPAAFTVPEGTAYDGSVWADGRRFPRFIPKGTSDSFAENVANSTLGMQGTHNVHLWAQEPGEMVKSACGWPASEVALLTKNLDEVTCPECCLAPRYVLVTGASSPADNGVHTIGVSTTEPGLKIVDAVAAGGPEDGETRRQMQPVHLRIPEGRHTGHGMTPHIACDTPHSHAYRATTVTADVTCAECRFLYMLDDAPGEVMRTILSEAKAEQAEGVEGWTVDFAEGADDQGNHWSGCAPVTPVYDFLLPPGPTNEEFGEFMHRKMRQWWEMGHPGEPMPGEFIPLVPDTVFVEPICDTRWRVGDVLVRCTRKPGHKGKHRLSWS